MYRALNARKINDTLAKLQARIGERFANSGLSRVCGDLINVAEQTETQVRALQRPYIGMRLSVAALIIGGLAAQFYAARFVRIEAIAGDAPALIEGLEAAVNLLILFGGAVWFLLTLEERMKRSRVLQALHELRSLAHVVDMHQLTKDPTLVLGKNATASSPQREMSQFERTRFLDYCAEKLALIGKLAALYAERTRDGVIIDA
ncbi:MAG: hypothetical protein AB7J28_04920, partial [Hyphomonadaceae bacterium]